MVTACGVRHRHAAWLAITLLALLCLWLGGCGSVPDTTGQRDGPGDPRDVSQVPDAVPRLEPRSRRGNPTSYVVFGQRYHTMTSSSGFVERGVASWYGSKFHGRDTSSGEPYDMYAMTAAHKHLPLPTYVSVTNLENGRRVVVRVNDRGPFHENRIIDLSYAAASRIGMLGKGTALVEIRAIDPSSPTRKVSQRLAEQDVQQPAALPAPSQAPRIYLQAGAFSSADNAQRLRARLENGLARSVRVVPAASASGSVHRVQVGPLASVEIADQVSGQMHQLGIREPLVVID